jgi:hypothetical protein
MKREEHAVIQAKMKHAIATKDFPPSICLPEIGDELLVSTLFLYPYLLWVPESLSNLMKCLRANCQCSPRINGYRHRLVHDKHHITVIYYCEYRCTAKHTASLTWNTLGKEYLESLESILEYPIRCSLPYTLTRKDGVSNELMAYFDDEITESKGLTSALRKLKMHRMTRYMRMRQLAAGLERSRSLLSGTSPPIGTSDVAIGTCAIPVLPTSMEYMECHPPPDFSTIHHLWYSFTTPLANIAHLLMDDVKVKSVLRIDGTFKISKKGFTVDSTGRRSQLSDGKASIVADYYNRHLCMSITTL